MNPKLPRVSGTKHGGTVPYKAVLGFPHINRIHTAYIGFRYLHFRYLKFWMTKPVKIMAGSRCTRSQTGPWDESPGGSTPQPPLDCETHRLVPKGLSQCFCSLGQIGTWNPKLSNGQSPWFFLGGPFFQKTPGRNSESPWKCHYIEASRESLPVSFLQNFHVNYRHYQHNSRHLSQGPASKKGIWISGSARTPIGNIGCRCLNAPLCCGLTDLLYPLLLRHKEHGLIKGFIHPTFSNW